MHERCQGLAFVLELQARLVSKGLRDAVEELVLRGDVPDLDGSPGLIVFDLAVFCCVFARVSL